MTEQVHFRLLVTPCCTTMLCWVNPRLPSFCPECGKSIYPEIKSCVTQQDQQARIIYTDEIHKPVRAAVDIYKESREIQRQLDADEALLASGELPPFEGFKL